MRLIGNKTKLLGNIESLLAERDIRGGTLIDVFAGTSSVGRHFKRSGFRVVSNDLLSSCYVQAVAGVEVSRFPSFRKLRGAHRELFDSDEFRAGLFEQGDLLQRPDDREARRIAKARRPLLEAVHLLNEHVEPREGLVFRSFCPGGNAGRQYFTDDNGRRIDGILGFLREALRDGTVTRGELYLLLSSLLDGADRVANISGTYGAFLKRFQKSALRPIHLAVPELIESEQKNRAYRENGNRLVRRVAGDVLYVDPPYNHRQYAANYHVLEVLAQYHEVEDVDEFEASLYGKTGLLPYTERKSDYCVRQSGRRRRRKAQESVESFGDVYSAMLDLVLSTKATSVVISYNEEGLLSRDEIGAILARFSGAKSYNYDRDFVEVSYKRFRSDRDRAAEPAGESGNGSPRSYKVLEGRERDQLNEWLFFATRGGQAKS